MKQKEKNIILFINRIPDYENVVEEIRNYGKKIKKDLRIALIVDKKNSKAKEELKGIDPDIELLVEFDKPFKVMKKLLPYQDNLLAITCRSEANIHDFIKIIPHVPYLKTPTQKSLDWAIEKAMMRKRFKTFDSKITPKFLIVENANKRTLEEIKEKVGFPLMLKPSNLASSLMINICFYEEELKDNMRAAFKRIKKIYKENGRKKEPKLLVEQYMEGDMFSIDAYVNSRGVVYFCPIVKVKTGKQIGFDDFFGYQRILPANVKKQTNEKAHIVARKAVHALGLRSTTVHIELMKLDDDWKVIEVGPRIGGYRSLMYKLAYGINHSLNDVLIRIPQKPVIPRKVKGNVAVLMFFAKKEGKLKSIKGIKKVKELESFYNIDLNKKIGNMCKFAKNGGKYVCNITLFNEDRSKLLADIRRLEKTLKIET